VHQVNFHGLVNLGQRASITINGNQEMFLSPKRVGQQKNVKNVKKSDSTAEDANQKSEVGLRSSTFYQFSKENFFFFLWSK
jgi:hypothetical protein